MKQEELREVIRKHKLWLKAEEGGEKASLEEAELAGANLQGADLRGAHLKGANLQGANLKFANLKVANLKGANLKGADLRWANLNHANLEWANIKCANLEWANLKDADLRLANLKDADLTLANLKEADLEGANLEGVNLRFSPNFLETKGSPPVYQASCGFGSRNSMLTLLSVGEEKDWMFFTGCFQGNKEELVAAVEEKHKGVERENYMRTINYLWETAQAHHSQDHGKLNINNQPIEKLK